MKIWLSDVNDRLHIWSIQTSVPFWSAHNTYVVSHPRR